MTPPSRTIMAWTPTLVLTPPPRQTILKALRHFIIPFLMPALKVASHQDQLTFNSRSCIHNGWLSRTDEYLCKLWPSSSGTLSTIISSQVPGREEAKSLSKSPYSLADFTPLNSAPTSATPALAPIKALPPPLYGLSPLQIYRRWVYVAIGLCKNIGYTSGNRNCQALTTCLPVEYGNGYFGITPHHGHLRTRHTFDIDLFAVIDLILLLRRHLQYSPQWISECSGRIRTLGNAASSSIDFTLRRNG